MLIRKTTFIFIFLVFIMPDNGICQDTKYDSLLLKVESLGKQVLYKNHDTSYIQSHAEELNVKLLAINKINFFRGRDKINGTSFRYRPDRQTNIGLGVAYKWFALDLAFNVGIREKSDVENSTFFDFQANVFSSKQFLSVSLQYYYGYQLFEYSGFETNSNFNNLAREDVRTLFFGLQYLFATNYSKFSLKAPFVLNEIQRKSAGSFLIGGSFKVYTMDADSILSPPQNTLGFDYPVTDMSNLRFALSFGYMYTFVVKEHFFLTLGFIPEIAFNMGDYQTTYRQTFNNHISFGFRTMNAIGYNGLRFFGGFQLIGDLFAVRIDEQYRMDIGLGKAKLFFGYRFNVKKKK